jgi:mannose-6-phosphate isomerase
MSLLRFDPIYQERVWGGRALHAVFGRSLPPTLPIGESWEIVDRPEAQSVVRCGAWQGLTLRSVIAEHGAAVMGPGWPADRRFPMLVKWLDCRERLSLQVHPPAGVAGELGGETKTENWYIAHTAAGAQLIVGLKRGVTRADFERAVAGRSVEECVHHFPVAAGDSILVQSGQVHAIDAGNLILEIQQNSDTTYRVYDWGRAGLDGKPRKLHISESLRSIQWDAGEPAPIRASPTSGVIADCAEFRIRRVVLGPGERLHINAGEEPRLLSVVSGRVCPQGDGGGDKRTAGKAVECGENILLPFSGAYTFGAETTTILLITENFSQAGAGDSGT